MRPAHKSISAGVWIVREQACFKFRSRSFKSIRTWSFDRYRFAEANPIRSFFSTPKRGKVYLCQRNFTLETSLSKPLARSCRNCSPRPARVNQRRSSKTATQDVHEALASSRCPLRKKPHQLLINSMARNSVAAPSKSMKPNRARIAGVAVAAVEADLAATAALVVIAMAAVAAALTAAIASQGGKNV